MTAPTHVYYVKNANYGVDPYVGHTLDGREVPGHVGGVMVCPRCASPLSVAQEQIEHTGEPCSVGHTGYRVDRILKDQQSRDRCGAHFKTVGTEEPVTSQELPTDWPRFVYEEFFSSGRPAFRRQIEWHGDV